MTISKEKRTQLILIGLITAGVMAALWFLLISAQRAKITNIHNRIAGVEREIQTKNQKKKESGKVQEDLLACEGKLCQYESTMPSGDPFMWVNSTFRKFSAVGYKVEMQPPSLPSRGDVNMLAGFPYQQLSVSVSGSAYYYDFGKFLADFENHFPWMRVQNLSLSPGGGLTPDEKEKLSFHLEVIILCKSNNS